MILLYVLSGTSMHDGSTKSFINLLRGVCRNGDKAIVVCPDKEGIYRYIREGKIKGAKAVCLNYTYNICPFTNSLTDYLLYVPRLFLRMTKNRLAARKLEKICRNENISLIHSNTSVNNIGFIAARQLAIPHIWHIREYGVKDFNMKVIGLRQMLHSKDNYVVSITRDILASRDIKEDRHHQVIYNGIVDSDDFRFNQTPDNYFLYAGRITERKGIYDLLRAYADYRKKVKGNIPVRLKIAGKVPPEESSRLESAIKDLGIAKMVDVLGARTDVADLMYNALAVIVPSLWEGFGRVLPEAMANGTLTIGRNTGGTREQYDNGLQLTGEEIGLRFTTVTELSQHLLKVSESGKIPYIPMIKRSQDSVKKLYTNQGNVTAISEFYRAICE